MGADGKPQCRGGGQMVADALDMDVEDVLAALDEEESSRIELQDGYTLILVDIPSIEIRHEKRIVYDHTAWYSDYIG